MEFVKYNSIENTYRTANLEKIAKEGKAGGVWIVEEKTHGCNYSLWYDGEKLLPATRKKFIDAKTSFHNHQLVIERSQEKIEKLYEALKLENPELDTIAVFGELIGGHYDHPEVERTNYKAVQKQVQYCPDIRLYCFDLKINGEFQNADRARELMESVGFLVAQPLFTGTLEECLEYNNKYNSTIPAQLGLPVIEGDNTCEGNVIKPITPGFIWGGEVRVILKNKNEKFREKENKLKVKTEVVLTDEAQNLLDEMFTYSTKNRLSNVLSKFDGELTTKSFGKLMGMMNVDCREDFMKDHGEAFNALEKGIQKKLNSLLGQRNAQLIRDNFKNIQDGNF